MSTNKEIGKRIRLRRQEIGMSQQELTDKLGFKSRSSINKIETEGRRINPERIEDFAKALDTSVEYIMGLENEIEIKKSDPKTYDIFREHILDFYNQLTDENKTVAENYLKFLLENQNKK